MVINFFGLHRWSYFPIQISNRHNLESVQFCLKGQLENWVIISWNIFIISVLTESYAHSFLVLRCQKPWRVFPFLKIPKSLKSEDFSFMLCLRQFFAISLIFGRFFGKPNILKKSYLLLYYMLVSEIFFVELVNWLKCFVC